MTRQTGLVLKTGLTSVRVITLSLSPF